MNKLMIACFTVVGLCGLSAIASAAALNSAQPPAATVSNTNDTITDVPYTLAKLQGKFQTLQTEVQNRHGLEAQDSGDTRYFFDAAPAPNPDGSPIPSGG
jgi:hypothetical protein